MKRTVELNPDTCPWKEEDQRPQWALLCQWIHDSFTKNSILLTSTKQLVHFVQSYNICQHWPKVWIEYKPCLQYFVFSKNENSKTFIKWEELNCHLH